MKKLLVVLLSVLLLFSFVSCKDKSEEIKADYEAKIQAQKDEQEEMIKNFEDFMDAYKKDISVLKSILVTSYSNKVFELTEENINIELSDINYPALNVNDFTDFITLEDGQKVGGPYGVDLDPAPSGYVTGISTDKNNFNLVYEENKMTLHYAVLNKSDDSQVKLDQKLEVTIDGTFKEVDNDDVHTVDYKITINDETYWLSYTYDKKTEQVTAAKINGKDVNVRLFNVEIKPDAYKVK